MYLSILTTIATLWGKAWPILVAVLFFGLVIMVHEVGHFSFAKLFRVKVDKFAMGMGPTLLKFGKKETEYSLRLFPIGGYVLMGEDEEASDDPRAFPNKPLWQRMLIIAAGAIMNLILGWLIVMLLLGVAQKPSQPGQPKLIGTQEIAAFHESEDGTPAKSQSTGLAVGDTLLKINGKRVWSQTDISFLMSRSADGVFDMQVKRDGKKINLTGVTFETMKAQEGKNVIIYDFIIRGVRPSLSNVPRYAFQEAASMSRIVWISLFDLLTGQYGLSDLSGPIGAVGYIAEAATQTTPSGERDYSFLLTIMALMTINIGIFNLLPVPAMDGGRLLFMLIELIFRRRVPAKYEGWIHAVGLVLLLIFMAVVSFSDIVNLIKR